MTLDVQVPTKIVIMGTSNMSLNDRFSKIKKIVVPASKQVVRPSRRSLLSNALAQSRKNVALGEPEEYEEEYLEDDVMEEEPVFDATYAAVRRTHRPTIARQHRVATIYQRPPIQERISFAPAAFRVASYTNNGFANHGRAGFRNNYNSRVQTNFRYNHNYGRLNGGLPRFQNNNGGFPPRYGMRGGGRGGRGGFQNNYQKKMQPKHTPEELDRELDEYMKKPANSGNAKHVPITMD